MASTAHPPQPLSFMTKLSPEVLLYRPSQDSPSPAASSGPKLILITSWTDASDQHISKYILRYQELFPHSQIALFKSTSALFFRPSLIVAAATQHLVPLIRSIFHTGLLPSSRPELLIHSFSNGGSASLASLHEAFAASTSGGTRGPSGDRLPLHVTIMDSAPSNAAPARLVAFLQVGMSPVARLLTAPVFYLVGYSWVLLVSVGVLTDWMAVWAAAHNDRQRNDELRRVYIYSEEDQLVDYRTVEAHADKAAEQGFGVRREKFVGSAHVAHSRGDEGRYWGIVRRVWFGEP